MVGGRAIIAHKEHFTGNGCGIMPFIVECPYCKLRARVPDRALGASGKCPRCAGSYTLVPADDQAAPELVAAAAADPSSSDVEPTAAPAAATATTEADAQTDAIVAAAIRRSAQEIEQAGADEASKPHADAAPIADASGLPAWLSVWGFAALMLGGLALLLATLILVRWFTLALSALGVATALVGLVRIARKRRFQDLSWLAVGGWLSLAVLGMTFLAPGMLNRYWGMDMPVPVRDPHKLVAIAKKDGRAFAPEDTVDAATEAIGQEGVVVRLMSVGLGPVEERGEEHTFLLVHFRIASSTQERSVKFEGFGADKHAPTLKDDAGQSYAFLEQRARKKPAAALIFQAGPARTVELPPMQLLDYQLVFAAPPKEFPPLVLELPASAWGRKGVCRFRIARLFEPSIPETVKKKEGPP